MEVFKIINIQRIFLKFLSYSFLKKFFITYFMVWCGFFIMLLISKIIYSIPSIFAKKTISAASSITTAKFRTVETVVSTTTKAVSSHKLPSYFEYSLTYFINNFSACLVIMFSFIALSYIYKKEINKGTASPQEYLNMLILFYIVIVLNPLTAIVGHSIDLKNILVLLPHGLFEFMGFSLSIVLGITIGLYILNPFKSIDNEEDMNNDSVNDINNNINNINNDNINNNDNNISINSKNSKVLKFIPPFLLIVFSVGLAALLEPIDWLTYNYSENNGLFIGNVMITVYKNIIIYIIHSILSVI